MNKKVLFVMLVSLLSVGLASASYADLTSNAAALVKVHVDPNIAVRVISKDIGGNLQTGVIEIPIVFRVDANSQYIKLSTLVTNLYKAGDATNPDVKPILAVAGSVPVDVTDGTDGSLLLSTATTYGDFAALASAEETFESSQNGHFSQEVELTPSWNNDDPEKPQGDYSGYVVLYAATP